MDKALTWSIATFVFAIFFVVLFRKEISKVIDDIGWFKTKWFEFKRIREDIFAKAEEVKRLSEELEKDRSNLRKSVRIFIETLYLTLGTRNRFPIPQPAANKINKNLNLLANLAVGNKKEDRELRKSIINTSELIEKSQKI